MVIKLFWGLMLKSEARLGFLGKEWGPLYACLVSVIRAYGGSAPSTNPLWLEPVLFGGVHTYIIIP